MHSEDEKVEIFRKHQPRLFGIAYRMLGMRDDAEDILQEAYIRWHKADTEEMNSPEAWLVTVVSRLSIDRLRKASVERETYIGTWLPEPILTGISPEEEVEMASDLSIAFLVMLERLSPIERAVFLLHDIFERGYDEIARIVGKSEAAARQMIHRARERVRQDRPRFKADEKDRARLVRQFAAASAASDEQTLLGLFSDDVVMMSDGGGKVHAARRPVYGRERLARLFSITTRKYPGVLEHFLIEVNGETALVTYADGQPFGVNTIDMENGKITALYRVMNPEKLRAFGDVARKGERVAGMVEID
jgi:RNA polymerase sigma-70 factor (ECF subfamily)